MADTVTRAQLTEAVYQEVGLSRNESAELVESVLAEISDALVRGEMVKLSSFGSFSVRQKGQRMGRNPKTGDEVPILPRRVLVFRPSHVLKKSINETLVGRPSSRLKRRRKRRPAPAPTSRIDSHGGDSDEANRGKSAAAFRTISEVAATLDVPQHVLRFWETKFSQVRPLKRGGGRRYYRPEDVELLQTIRSLLYDDGYTIKGVQKLLRDGTACRSAARAREAPARAPRSPRHRRRRPKPHLTPNCRPSTGRPCRACSMSSRI